MTRNLIIVLALFMLNSCATTSSALLGPIFTGATTGSIYQASLSYGTGKILSEMVPNEFYSKKIQNNQNPIIIANYKVDKISFSEVKDPEPLP